MFDLTSAMNSFCVDMYNTPQTSSVFSVDVRFKTHLSENLTGLIMCELDKVLALPGGGQEPYVSNPFLD